MFSFEFCRTGERVLIETLQKCPSISLKVTKYSRENSQSVSEL